MGLSWGGIAVLAVVLAGCSSITGQTESTAAIAGPAPASTAANGAVGGDGTALASTPGNGPAIGKAITLADASCDQIKAELTTFDADKIPQKLADFGKAKYHPTAEESIRFARYVDVSKAGKDKNCSPASHAMKKKKQVTASKTPVDPATKKVMKATTTATTTATTATAAAKAVVKKATPAVDANQPADEGVTVQVPDSSG